MYIEAGKSEQFLWEREFELEQNRYALRFNQPEAEINKLDISDESYLYKNTILVDRRVTLLELKQKIAA